ncbi:MAG: aminomethyltransferase family protein [Pseudomonadota bacterium]
MSSQPPLNVRNVVTSLIEPGFNYGYQNSPFFEFDYARQATHLVYNGRLMPISFADSNRFDDHKALRTAAAMYPTGELPTEIKGPDAERLCNKVFTKEISKVKPGRCVYAIACYPYGGLIVDGILVRLAQDRFWYVQAEGQIYAWLVAQAQGLDVAVFDPDVWVNQVQGPHSMAILEAVCDDGMPDPFPYFEMAETVMGGQKIVVTRTGFSAEMGWEYYVFPDTDCPALWRHLMDAGEPFGMVHSGLDSLDIRRIEAGILNAGSDFDRTTTPFEVGLHSHVDFEKPDFIGREALMSASREPILYGLRCSSSEPHVAGIVKHSGREVGTISAAAWSPTLECGIGYVRLLKPGLQPGADVSLLGIDGAMHDARLVDLPFFDEQKLIPRGLR